MPHIVSKHLEETCNLSNSFFSNHKTIKERIMKRQILLIIIIPILFIGLNFQAQVNTKVNLNFENKVQA
jgi:hypothetical protein